MKRNFFLDALRGVLAWVIVLCHVAWFAGYTHSGLRGWLGSQAVNVFCIIAGYTATMTYRQPLAYPLYLARKLWRILPTLGAAWALALLAGSGLTPAWYVALILQFILIFPALMWLIGRYGRKMLLWFFAIGMVGLLPPVYGALETFFPLGEFLLMNFAPFVIGMIAFELVDPYVMTDLSAAAERHWLLIRLGEISYSTYLVHWPLLFWTAQIVPSAWPMPLRLAVIALLGVPATLGLSLLVHELVELPGIALGKRRIDRIESQRAIIYPI